MRETYTASRDQRTDGLLAAAALIGLDGYTPQLVSAHDARLTLLDAVTQSAGRWANQPVALNDLWFLVLGRQAIESTEPLDMWMYGFNDETAHDWLCDLAEHVQDGMAVEQ